MKYETSLKQTEVQVCANRVDSLGKKIALIGNIAWSEREMSEDGFFVTNENGEWIDCNKAFLKRVNATKEDILKNGWRGFLAHSCSEHVIDEYETIIKEQRSGDLPCSFRRDILGSAWHFNLYIQLMKNDGRIIGYTGLLKLKP